MLSVDIDLNLKNTVISLFIFLSSFCLYNGLSLEGINIDSKNC